MQTYTRSTHGRCTFKRANEQTNIDKHATSRLKLNEGDSDNGKDDYE